MGHSGLMLALVAESLVPWGFMLFYLRATGQTRSFLFKLICVGGMGTLSFRALIWTYCVYVHNFSENHGWKALPVGFSVFVNVALATGYYLEVTWFKLYLRNFMKSLKKETMGKRTPSMTQL
jgi:hypothetical protein